MGGIMVLMVPPIHAPYAASIHRVGLALINEASIPPVIRVTFRHCRNGVCRDLRMRGMAPWASIRSVRADRDMGPQQHQGA